MITLGTLSGRECDKVKKAGLTPVFFENAVTFSEANTTLLCKKIYRQDMDISFMPVEAIKEFYKEESPHTMFIGEVMKIF